MRWEAEKMTQPSWLCIANLGDASPLDYGGTFVLVDRRGVYDPELWYLRPYCPDAEPGRAAQAWGELFRFRAENCHRIWNGGDDRAIGDNPYHANMPAWFGDAGSLRSLADSIGRRVDDLIDDFISGDPVRRAQAWLSVGEHWGFENLDSYPYQLQYKEASAICRRAARDIKRAEKFNDGWS
jgi:hypothetical protein